MQFDIKSMCQVLRKENQIETKPVLCKENQIETKPVLNFRKISIFTTRKSFI